MEWESGPKASIPRLQAISFCLICRRLPSFWVSEWLSSVLFGYMLPEVRYAAAYRVSWSAAVQPRFSVKLWFYCDPLQLGWRTAAFVQWGSCFHFSDRVTLVCYAYFSGQTSRNPGNYDLAQVWRFLHEVDGLETKILFGSFFTFFWSEWTNFRPPINFYTSLRQYFSELNLNWP